MQEYFDQVRTAAGTKLYFLALGGALVIPDMCSGMEAPDGKTSGALYAAWVDQHLASKFTAGPDNKPSFSGDDCYGLRCSLLHQGRLIPHKGGYSRVLFVEPNPTIFFHNNIANDALIIDVPTFVLQMVDSAEAWYSAAKDTPNFQANCDKYMQRRPNGLAPYMVGISVIA